MGTRFNKRKTRSNEQGDGAIPGESVVDDYTLLLLIVAGILYVAFRFC